MGGQLQQQGYAPKDIVEKKGLTSTYVHGILTFLRQGEERLVVAVEKGLVPLNAAVTIVAAGNNDAEVQAALRHAYESGKLRRKQPMNARRVIKRRKALGRSTAHNMTRKSAGVTTSSLVRTYERQPGANGKNGTGDEQSAGAGQTRGTDLWPRRFESGACERVSRQTPRKRFCPAIAQRHPDLMVNWFSERSSSKAYGRAVAIRNESNSALVNAPTRGSGSANRHSHTSSETTTHVRQCRSLPCNSTWLRAGQSLCHLKRQQAVQFRQAAAL